MFILRYRNLTPKQLDELDNRPDQSDLILKCHKILALYIKQMVVTRMPEFENDNVFRIETTNMKGETDTRNYVQAEYYYGTYPKLYDIIDQLSGSRLDELLDWGDEYGII